MTPEMTYTPTATPVVPPPPISCDNPSIVSSGIGANEWNNPRSWVPSRVPVNGDFVRILPGHTIIVSEHQPVTGICNSGTISSATGDDIQLKATGIVENTGEIIASDGADWTECGRGGNLLVYGAPVINYGDIASGSGTSTQECIGQGGALYIFGRNVVNAATGTITAGDGGSLPVSTAGSAGNGGSIHIWGNYQGDGFLMNRGEIRSGDGGDAHFQTTACQNGGDGGDLVLVASPLLDISSGGQHAGAGGVGSLCGENGKDGSVTIEPPQTIMSGADTRISGGDIRIYCGNDCALNMNNMDEGAITSSGSVLLAVGDGGTIDMSGNGTNKIVNAASQVNLAADTVIVDPGETISTTLDANSILLSESQLVRGVALGSQGQLRVTGAGTIEVLISLSNLGSPLDVFDVTISDSEGWTLSGIPGTLAVEGLTINEFLMTIEIPAGMVNGVVDVITLSARSQAEASVSDTITIDVVYEPYSIALPMILNQ